MFKFILFYVKFNIYIISHKILHMIYKNLLKCNIYKYRICYIRHHISYNMTDNVILHITELKISLFYEHPKKPFF